MTTLTEEELKELLRLAFNEGLKTGKNITPLNEISMGSKLINPIIEFDKFIKEIFTKLK